MSTKKNTKSCKHRYSCTDSRPYGLGKHTPRERFIFRRKRKWKCCRCGSKITTYEMTEKQIMDFALSRELELRRQILSLASPDAIL